MKWIPTAGIICILVSIPVLAFAIPSAAGALTKEPPVSHCIGGGYRSAQPPPDFSPLHASNAELACYGFPQRPSGKEQLAEWTSEMSHFRRYVVATVVPLPGVWTGRQRPVPPVPLPSGSVSIPQADVPITQEQAVKAVQRYAPGLFKEEVMIGTQTANVDLSSQKVRLSNGAFHTLGHVRSWVVTITGLDVPQFAHDPWAIHAGAPQRRFHTAKFIVDGKSGAVLRATWS